MSIALVNIVVWKLRYFRHYYCSAGASNVLSQLFDAFWWPHGSADVLNVVVTSFECYLMRLSILVHLWNKRTNILALVITIKPSFLARSFYIKQLRSGQRLQRTIQSLFCSVAAKHGSNSQLLWINALQVKIWKTGVFKRMSYILRNK